MASSTNPLRPVAFLGVLVFFVGGLAYVRQSGEPPAASDAVETAPCPDGLQPPCPARSDPAGTGTSEDGRNVPDAVAGPALEAGEVCPGAGYLCAGLEHADSIRILRYSESASPLTVRIPAPDHEDPVLARRLQRAAARGIQAWESHPFPIRILEGELGGRADLEITWTRQLRGSALGRTRTRYRSGGGETHYRAVDLTLATRSPHDGRRVIDPREIQLVSAHEMGHALGLAHSDDPNDVLYPTNTATHLTARDYRSLEALYGLPNGAVIR